VRAVEPENPMGVKAMADAVQAVATA